MRQWYKPSLKEWTRLYNLPFYVVGGVMVHYEDINGVCHYYELDGMDLSVDSWTKE